MKILALVILLFLLISRIKGTPSMLSKTLYLKKMQKVIDKQKSNSNKELDDVYKGAAILLVLLFEILLMVFYIIVGTKLGTTYMFVLSALQVITCIYTTGKQLFNKNVFSQDIKDYKFYRLYFLFNVVLDYMYYPVAIYMLLT